MISPKTVIVTFVIAAVAVAATVLTSETPRDARAAGRSAPLVSAEQLHIESVERITLLRRGETPHVFARTAPMAWTQVEPFAYPMDAAMMRGLAVAARDVAVVERIASRELGGDSTLATLGLDPPEATLTFETTDGNVGIELGRRGIAGRAYARLVGGDDVLIVSQELHERAVEMSPKEWRDRRLFRNVGIDCDRIVREDGAMRLVLERDRRTWRMLEPVQTRVDQGGLVRFMQTLGSVRSAGFIADQPADAALARFGLAAGTSPAFISVACTAAQSQGEDIARIEHEQHLNIGNPAGAGTQDRFGIVDGRPTVVRVPANALAALFANPVELIDPTGSGVIPADVKSIRILSGGQTLHLERDLERWTAPDRDGRDVPAALVQDLLTKLTEFRAPAMEIREYPRELEQAIVTFFGFDARPMDTVRVLHHEGTGQWALENGDNVLRVFPRGFELPLTAGAFGLRE